MDPKTLSEMTPTQRVNARAKALFDPAFLEAMSRLRDAEELSRFATAVQAKYPTAVKTNGDEIALEDGSIISLDEHDNDDPFFDHEANRLFQARDFRSPWLGFDTVREMLRNARHDAHQVAWPTVVQYVRDNGQAVVIASSRDAVIGH